MIEIALMSRNEQALLYREIASISGINSVIIEKDFWVCFMLEHLFNRSIVKDNILFKGGTSLSKCYDVIKRFSEDIDIIIDWQSLGYKDEDVFREQSFSSQNRLNGDINNRTSDFLANFFIPKVHMELTERGFTNFKLLMDSVDPLTVLFQYDAVYQDSYVIPQIRLEIGALAAKFPYEQKVVKPYVQTYLPQVFSNFEFRVKTITAVRTLFEKMTILHAETNRLINHPIRYARHFYDTYMISNT